MLCSLFKELKNLFLLAPEQITLTGSYYWVDDEKAGEYEKINFNKDKLISLFTKAASWHELMEKDDSLYIMHFGI
jgi:hypothetical protein